MSDRKTVGVNRLLTDAQQAVAQRSSVRLRRKTDEDGTRRTQPEAMGVHDTGSRQDDLGGRIAEARGHLPGW